MLFQKPRVAASLMERAMDLLKYNRWAWDEQVSRGNKWTRPVAHDEIDAARQGKWEVVVTPTRPVPRSWFGELSGKRVLCLAGGGGQQAPILAAAGANVTTIDNSPRQLERDQEVAEREGLEIATQLGDMRDLSSFPDATFDLVFNPCSNGFVDDVRVVWREVARVLRPGGRLITGFSNPLLFIFDYGELEQGRMKVAHTIPYSDLENLSDPEMKKLREDAEPVMFGHTLEDQIAGQLDAGLQLTGMFEDVTSEGPDALIGEHIPIYMATCAVKVS